MSERIKRYMMIAESHTCGDGTPGAKVREAEHPIGAWCRSTDVDAIEAENARLRRIVEAAEKMDYAIGQASGSMQIDAMVDDKGEFFGTTKVAFAAMKEAKAAYDAAKAQPTQQGEKKE